MALLGKNLRHFGIASVTVEIESRKQSARSVEIRGLEIVLPLLRRNTDSHPLRGHSEVKNKTKASRKFDD